MTKQKFGFTLAEVLIVIGIIGVVAALTLPNLNHATGDKEKVTKVKKIYSTLNEAYDRAQVIYGNAENWYSLAENYAGEEDNTDITISNLFTTRIAEFLKVSKTVVDDYIINIYLPEGICFYVSGTETMGPSKYHSGQTFLGYIKVDLDGFDLGKNKEGFDQFTFEITNIGIYPEGINDEDINCIFSDYGWGQSRWILENDNADYLKTDSNGKCNDSDVILNWTTNTSCH